ncbi:MAG: Coq4 family protein [Cyanobacteriota bacterium]|nr:Coq4 family protein [Cyanobacteriota bacterium]
MTSVPAVFATGDVNPPEPSGLTEEGQAMAAQLQALLPELVRLSEQPDRVASALALLNGSYGTPWAAAARRRLRLEPAIAALVAERYWGPWPGVEALAALPVGSLGHGLAKLLQQAGLELIPRPEGLDQLADDDAYLQLRARACHDIWHLVTGCPNTLAGEVALNGFGARQLRQPGPVLLIAADLFSRALGPDTSPDLADAVAFGLQLGGVAAPLLAQRWEEGWSRPLAQWRHELGLTEALAQSPFRGA